MILITAALECELRPFRRLAPSDVALLPTGIGRGAVERALSAFLAEHRPQIELLISCGFAGGLVPGLRPGELVLAERLLWAGREIKVERELLLQASQALEPLEARHGPILTVTEPIRDVEEKARLGRDSGALVVEMEAFWAAKIAQDHRVPFLAVKAVLDPLERPLPEFVTAVGLGGELSVKAIRSLLSRPWQLREVPRLAGAARLAAGRLARALAALVSAFARASEVEEARC
jgi:adenosylhomocysteine nucleosidase